MQAALKAHFKRLLKRLGQTVTYSSGTTTKSVKAVKTKPRAKQVDAADSVIISSSNWDWLIDPEELSIEPALGHSITDAAGVKYKIQPSNPNDLPFSWSDGFKTFMRVHSEEQ